MEGTDSSGPSSIAGRLLRSETQEGVQYRLLRHLGEGSMGMAYLAHRETEDGVSPVVVKAVLPSRKGGEISAELLARKEAVALGRLNERLPPTPFVVRLLDAGSAPIFAPIPSPWLAIEYVHGGVEGTTLDDRVVYSVHKTGFAFDCVRAAHAIRCLSSGLTAIHAVNVIHRDLSPGNVLCCGFGETEIFKISDFGVARPEGLDMTFADMGVGTIGYAAPEQILPGKTPIRPYTDVFSLGCVSYFLLTGMHLFDDKSPIELYQHTQSGERNSIRVSPVLSPELADHPARCRAIDEVLARATSADAQARPPTADRLASELTHLLTNEPAPPRSSRRLITAMIRLAPGAEPAGWSWSMRQRAPGNMVIRSAAWDTDGHCFVLSTHGPVFWSGEGYRDASGLRLPEGMGFVRRYEAGGWLVGGAAGRLALCSPDGLSFVVQTPDPHVDFSEASGRLDGMLVAVGRRSGEGVSLHCLRDQHWMAPRFLNGVANVSTLSRLNEDSWMLAGRLNDGGGFAAIFIPEQGELRFLPTPKTRAFVAGSSNPERGLGLVVSSGPGVALRFGAEGNDLVVLPGEPDLTACAVDILDRHWVSSVGALWTRDPRVEAQFRLAWTDQSWEAPFVSLMADAGRVLAMTAEGGILEGRR